MSNYANTHSSAHGYGGAPGFTLVLDGHHIDYYLRHSQYQNMEALGRLEYNEMKEFVTTG